MKVRDGDKFLWKQNGHTYTVVSAEEQIVSCPELNDYWAFAWGTWEEAEAKGYLVWQEDFFVRYVREVLDEQHITG